MNGILPVRKEKGYTSFDVVAVLRGILREKKIGHAGTLDPDAAGVLVCCAGNATKIISLLTDTDKEYEAGLRLGITTDTQDAGGRVIREMPVSVTEDVFRGAVRSFSGKISQIPPMYSAVHVGGKRLYELAREGKEVERPPREVFVHSISVGSFDGTEAVLRIVCSKGTYVRTICHDIGEKLGCGAVMTSLTRTRSGIFRLEDCLTLREIEAAADKEKLLIPCDRLFHDCPAFTVSEGTLRAALNGNAFSGGGVFAEGRRVRIYTPEGRFLALYRADRDGMLRPEKMFL